MSKDADSPFSPAAIAKASGRRFRGLSAQQSDRAQHGDKPSDFGDHEPIPDEAVVQVKVDSEIVEEKE